MMLTTHLKLLLMVLKKVREKVSICVPDGWLIEFGCLMRVIIDMIPTFNFIIFVISPISAFKILQSTLK